MVGRRVIVGFAIVGLMAGVQALSQERARPERPEARRDVQAQQRTRPQGMMRNFQERMLERMKETLEASDEEWKVLQPRIEKVLTLSRETRSMGGFGQRFRRPGGEATGQQAQQTQVEKAQQELRTVLENKEAKPEEIKQKLTALREAVEKAKQELAKAQQELREILSVRQEAQMVLMGLLN